MTWQFIIILQIIVSALMTIFTRHISLSTKHAFFIVGVASYLAIAVAGWMYAVILGSNGIIPPSNAMWPLLLVEGVCIPAAWLVQYQLIRRIGASNTAIVTMLNTVMTAAFGIVLLHDTLSLPFAVGGLLILTGVAIALRLRPDEIHTSELTLPAKYGLVALGAILFSIGMWAEKTIVDDIGSWNYMGFGWTMQALGALALLLIFGRSELKKLNKKVITKGIILGLITSIAGGLYVYAIGLGTLSHTIVATSGKVVIVMVIAAFVFRERNNLIARITSFVLTVVGLALIFS